MSSKLPSPEPPPPFLFVLFSFSPLPYVLRVLLLTFHSGNFDPTSVISPSVRWVSFDGSSLEVAQGMAEGNTHIASQFVEDVISGQSRADVSMLTFRDRDFFVAGNLHNHFPAWERIANIAPFDLTPKILLWIKNCVDVQDFFQPFKGQYRGENSDSTFPRIGFFLTLRLVNRLLNLFPIPLFIG